MAEIEKTIGAHIEGIGKMRQYSQNEFEHADAMVRSDLDDEREALANLSALVDKHIQLANIAEPVIRYYQQDGHNIVNLASQARRMDELKLVFYVIYYGWRSELLLTKAKDGTERRQQGAVGAKYVPYGQHAAGFGESLEQMDPEEQSILDKIFGKKKKPQQ
jgi:hypothetical protein